ncbi:MAG: BMC domain-containing protein [Firmicutes bacterium]|nr:BMC domain-containing protein [Bacillota bacterium]
MSNAIGFVETRGLVAAIEAADVMVKSADVKIIEYRLVGSGLVNITVQGEVAAVKVAVDTAVERVRKLGEAISFHVVPRPHEDLLKVIPLREAIEP